MIDPKNNDKEEKGKLLKGYKQVYIVKQSSSVRRRSHVHEVFYQCGNCCYEGMIQFDFLENDKMTLQDIPNLIPMIQKQHDDLSFVCEASRYVDASFRHRLSTCD